MVSRGKNLNETAESRYIQPEKAAKLTTYIADHLPDLNKYFPKESPFEEENKETILTIKLNIFLLSCRYFPSRLDQPQLKELFLSLLDEVQGYVKDTFQFAILYMIRTYLLSVRNILSDTDRADFDSKIQPLLQYIHKAQLLTKLTKTKFELAAVTQQFEEISGLKVNRSANPTQA